MKTIRYQIIFLIALSSTTALKSNNILVSNVRLTGQNTSSHYTLVQFDITWENSWRYTGGPANWDAAWVFIKYRVGPAGTWKHAWLNSTGHTACTETTIKSGLFNPALAYNNVTNPVMGAFLYRSAAGAGTFSCQGVKLRWNYGDNTVTDAAQVDIKVFAIEMVYVPQGSFYVGSGGSEYNAFYTYPNTTSPYYITSEAAITVGTAVGNLYYPTSAGNGGDHLGPIPAAYPKGFKAFYAMKYEITQQAYTDFLNTLTRSQQIGRVASDISGPFVTNEWVMSNTITQVGDEGRSYIRCRTPAPSPPAPVEFYVDANANEIAGDIDDGQNVACSFLSYFDVAAYLSWSALRPMSEFEFEKCGRGPLFPTPNEYAWGNLIHYSSPQYTSLSTPAEAPAKDYVNGLVYHDFGPVRVGAFARSNGNRTTSGAGYYGCMELSTNLYERGVSVGSPEGRLFTGGHGNGVLDSEGRHNISDWPDPFTGVGSFVRGGTWQGNLFAAQLSDRFNASWTTTARVKTYGGRGVRTE